MKNLLKILSFSIVSMLLISACSTAPEDPRGWEKPVKSQATNKPVFKIIKEVEKPGGTGHVWGDPDNPTIALPNERQ